MKEKLKKVMENHYSFMASLQLTQKILNQVWRNFKEKGVLTEVETKKRGGMRQERVPGEATNRQQYDVCVQNCFHSFARVVYDQILASRRNWRHLSGVLTGSAWPETGRSGVRS